MNKISNSKLFGQQKGALHLASLFCFFLVLALLYIFAAWQRQIDREYAEIAFIKQHMELIDAKVKALETKAGL